jgi:thiamine-monophosphate kinase
LSLKQSAPQYTPIMGEFDLINRYFKRAAKHPQVLLGNGDDCALLGAAPGQVLAVSSDMLVEGRHFLPGADPRLLGHKALAVNLSDLAAMGAEPLGFTLALALPRADEAWLSGFSQGLLALAGAHACDLVGGDTTAGPLNICITVFGQVPQGQALRRSGAQVGDDIYVSGANTAQGLEIVGQARLALDMLQGRVPMQAALFDTTAQRLHAPTPRVGLGQQLRGIASAAIDVSDGLLGDLGHILRASGVGAQIEADVIATEFIAACAIITRAIGLFDIAFARQTTLSGGDDYELCFTAPVHARQAVQAACAQARCSATRIGRIESAAGLRLVDAQGQALTNTFSSWDHFA